MNLTLDYDNMLAENIGPEHGLSSEHLTQIADQIERRGGYHEQFEEMRRKNVLAFTALAYDEEALEPLQDLANDIRNDFEFFVHLGIGGSVLGAMALHTALTDGFYNFNPMRSRGADGKKSPQVFFVDNIDPDVVSALVKVLDLKKTFFHVVSKSGSTTETLAQFLYLQQLLEKSLGNEKWQSHFAFTTDPEKGDLREMAKKFGVRSLSVPSAVSGRFSVLSPVGLLTAAVCGVKVKDVLSGARSMLEKCRTKSFKDNPAYLSAALLYLAHTKFHKSMVVMMPYSDRLMPFSSWFCQLYAESLGKKEKGMTPIASKGVTDQHSQLQLFLDGPNDKVTLFVQLDEFGEDCRLAEMSPSFKNYEGLGYLSGQSLRGILDAEFAATRQAFMIKKRPNMTFKLSELNAEALGELFMLNELSVAFAGMLYQVNPFDQPAVELGKKLTFHLLGRPGFEVLPGMEVKAPKARSKYVV